MKKIPLRWILLGGLIYAALITFLFLVLILPQNLKVRELRIKLHSDTSGASEMQKQKEVLLLKAGLREAGSSLENRLSTPTKSVFSRILNLSQKTRVHLLSVTPGGEASFKIAFAGEYRQIADFIRLLETDQVLFRIDRLILGNSENLSVHQGEIDIVTYTK